MELVLTAKPPGALDPGNPEALSLKVGAFLAARRPNPEFYKAEMPGTVRVEVVSERADTSEHGWPISLAVLRVLDDGGTLVEERLHVVYTILSWVVSAVVSAKPHTLETNIPELLPFVKSGTMRNTKDDILTLHQLFR